MCLQTSTTKPDNPLRECVLRVCVCCSFRLFCLFGLSVLLASFSVCINTILVLLVCAGSARRCALRLAAFHGAFPSLQELLQVASPMPFTGCLQSTIWLCLPGKLWRSLRAFSISCGSLVCQM